MRKLRLIDATAIGVNAIVGSGVFAIPDDLHRSMGGYSPFAFLFCALLVAPVALCFAELASRVSKNGGPVVYATEAFGEVSGFFMGWTCWLNAFLSFAANATLCAALLSTVLPSPWNGAGVQRAFVVTLLLFLAAINIRGVAPAAWLVKAMVIGKVGAVLMYIIVAVMHFRYGSRLGGALPAVSGVANGVYLALFPLQGFEVVPVTAGETVDPQRNIPRATLMSLGLAALLFVVVQTVLVGAFANLSTASDTTLVDAARFLFPWLGVVVLFGSVMSTGGFTAGSALGAPRYLQAMAEAGQLPAAVGAVDPKRYTPARAIVITTVAAALSAMFFDYGGLVRLSNTTVLIQYAVTCAAVPVLRRRATSTTPVSWAKLGLLVPVLGIVGSIVLLSFAEPLDWWVTLGAVGVGALVYLPLWLRKRKRV